MRMRPYKFEVFLRETLWGGDRLIPFKGLPIPRCYVGESWEISGVPAHESVVAERGISSDGDVGLTLSALIGKYGAELVGSRIYEKFGTMFPLLVKFIDARRDLSIQVHPNDELARARHGCLGKSEMWYVLEAEPGAKVYSGLRRAISKPEFDRLVSRARTGNPFADVVAAHDSHKGDAFYLPAGRIHSLGAGNLVVEIQQASDVTYRICDFGRTDAQGRTRELHTELARDAIDYADVQAEADYRVRYDAAKAQVELVSCPYFRVSLVTVTSSAHIDLGTDSFVILVCLKGAAEVNGISVRQGETVLVPACSNILDIVGSTKFLVATA